MNEKFPVLNIFPKGSSGVEIRAKMGKTYNCVEFTMRDDCPIPIFYSPWIQFEPTEMYEDRLKLAYEMVRRFNMHDDMLKEFDALRVKVESERKLAMRLIEEEREIMRKYYEKVKAANPDIVLPNG